MWDRGWGLYQIVHLLITSFMSSEEGVCGVEVGIVQGSSLVNH